MTPLGRPRRVQDDDVFAAMAAVLLRVGLPRLTVALVAEELGVTPAALRQRFGGKRELLTAFHAWSTDQVATQLDEAFDDTRPVRAVVHGWIRASVASISAPEQVLNAMSALTDVSDDRRSRELTADRLRLATERLTALFERAVAEGALTGIEPAELARLLGHCVLGASLAWSVSASARPLDAVLAETADLLLAPYLPDSPGTADGTAGAPGAGGAPRRRRDIPPTTGSRS